MRSAEILVRVFPIYAEQSLSSRRIDTYTDGPTLWLPRQSRATATASLWIELATSLGIVQDDNTLRLDRTYRALRYETACRWRALDAVLKPLLEASTALRYRFSVQPIPHQSLAFSH
jgi:hypothetical protein